MVEKISKEVQAEALKMAKGNQRPKQTKEQTRLIAHGIEKGIADYKKQQKAIARERDKIRKKEKLARESDTGEQLEEASRFEVAGLVPWALLALSWVCFILFYILTDQ